ncbi:tryptophan dimethylallyltransferase family protein [Candidatus Tisiphia endosymbiont of Mystacides longicornis]|uniref:tryptophan dimethylallyltransferase family protein n=1 Tax=Candidatus Tisiphia endosymbiont of Mystacides longicornis TaxID=3139330 RepID=UPI003CCA8E96
MNPRILGEKKAPELVHKALTTLNAKVAWNFLFPRLSNSESKLAFLSLDLSTDVKARIKVYVANQLINDIESQLQGCRYYVNGTASSWIKTLINKENLFNVKPIVITFNFTVGNDFPVPTIHIPVNAYVKNDGIVIQRLNKLLSPSQVKILTAIISQISKRPLESGSFLTYISLRPSENGQLDITCYLSSAIFDL